ncbi:spondin domain-containing protein [Aureibaculum sp. 2210JD6-5]|uniref:T9SS type A sorting domain-containing protein n=1 Tax=Aureibaculum sp. 2210JD6-5 TaxID=3103957 RepID=UPI002AAD66C7|nr:spondin domain-containing protein [Aureibaculum sp. 2210JD6-5]MDY7394678.1 spondin domain-containing protein [Aureibaculum sp. 2210JD6-5]
MFQKLLSIGLFLLFLVPLNAQKVSYKIEFISNWSSTTHPNQYPSGSAHWSPLVGASHNASISFFNIGQLATDGVEQVAETGATSTIENEIATAISNNTTYKLIKGSGLSTGPGTITIDDVEIDANFPLVSLITMIAPSPDWVAQVNSVKLTDASNNWLQELSLEVYASDAGTDNGTTYGSSNSNTDPAVNMFSLEDTAPFSDQIVGTFKFTFLKVLSTDDDELERAVSVYPNPSNGEISINNIGTHILEKAEIFSVNGQKVKEFKQISKNNNLNITSLQSGLYFIKLKSDRGSTVKKIIVN